MKTIIDSAYQSVLMDRVVGVLDELGVGKCEVFSVDIMTNLYNCLKKSRYDDGGQGDLFFHLVGEAVTNLPREKYLETYSDRNVGDVILELGMETVSENVENWKKSLGE